MSLSVDDEGHWFGVRGDDSPVGRKDGGREKTIKLGPWKQGESRWQNRITETRRKPDTVMLARNRDRE